MKTTNNTIEQQRAENVYLWLVRTEQNYNRVLTAIGNSVAGGIDDARIVSECASEMLYRQYFCSKRTGDNVYYTLPRIEYAVARIMNL